TVADAPSAILPAALIRGKDRSLSPIVAEYMPGGYDELWLKLFQVLAPWRKGHRDLGSNPGQKNPTTRTPLPPASAPGPPEPVGEPGRAPTQEINHGREKTCLPYDTARHPQPWDELRRREDSGLPPGAGCHVMRTVPQPRVRGRLGLRQPSRAGLDRIDGPPKNRSTGVGLVFCRAHRQTGALPHLCRVRVRHGRWALSNRLGY